MAISFNQIPSALRVPLVYAEFDSSNAIQGPVTLAYKGLLFGQMLTAGTATADTLVPVTSAEGAADLFGEGSQLHHMAVAWFSNNPTTELYAMPVAEPAGVQASGTIVVTGPATEAGSIDLYIAGRNIEIAVASGDSANSIAAAIEAAIDADTSLPVTAGVSTNTVTITAKQKGLIGNQIDIRVNYYTDEATPAGVGLAITAMSGGTLAPSLTNAIAALGDEWFNVIAFGWNDSTSLSAIKAEMTSRAGPLRMIDGMVFASKDDTHANLLTFGDAHNNAYLSFIHNADCPHPSYEWAAAAAAVASYYLAIDPARPLQTLPLAHVLPPSRADRFTINENNQLLYHGISTHYVDADGTVRLQTVITTYKQNALGADDESYLYVETVMTLSYLRYDLRVMFLTKYPRHKLADDGTRYGPGQAIITPKVAKAEVINRARQWEELGLVENIDAFKESLIVERNTSNRQRLDMQLAPDVVNQLRIVGQKISFVL